MSAGPITILLVDADEDDYLITRNLFAELDPGTFQVEWASSYEAALAAMIHHGHDVYVIDFWLGGKRGLDLMKEAKASGAAAPMILLTGVADDNMDLEAMRAGAADFLVKGQITSKSLGRSIRYAVERNRAEQIIQKLAAFPRTNPNPVLEFSAEGTVIYCNDAAHRMAVTLGQDSLIPLLPPETDVIIETCLSTGQNNMSLQTTVQNRTLAWSFIPVAATHTVHCYATDITERLNLEAQLRHSVKMEAIGQLAAGVAHDFNNILTIIQGHADLLSKSPSLPGANQKSLREICTAADRAGKLIRQLLMFSRMQVMQQRNADLNEIIHNLSRMVQRLVGEHISFEFHPAPHLPAIHADVGMIEQLLVNLIINSRDAMASGGKLTITTSEQYLEPVATVLNPDARPGHFVCVKVTDTGCGMDSETLSHLFEPFFTTKEIGKGTGLGLASVYGITKQHHGWILVESEVGQGATFTLFFPSAGKVPEPPQKSPSSVKLNIAGGDETILIAEDEPALRELVVNILEFYGYRIFQAQNGVEAIQIWEQHKSEIDLLLTDMVMPQGVSGRQLAERLQKDDPALKVIYTSGYSPGMAGKDIALLEGCNFLAKPYPPSRLAQLVRECLDLKPVKKA